MKLRVIWWYFFNKKKYHKYRIYKWLIDAKKYLLEHKPCGMCTALINTYWDRIGDTYGFWFPNPEQISFIIPEFTSEYLIGIHKSPQEHWWPIRDVKSRITAFNTLINLYHRYVYDK